MLTRLTTVPRLPLRIFTMQNVCQPTVRCMASEVPNQGPPYHTPSKLSEHLYGSRVIKTTMTESGEAKLNHNGLFIPEGDWAKGNAKLQKRWNMWLGVAIVAYVATAIYAIKEYGLYPSGYFPLAICKEPSAFPDYMKYKADSTRYIQHYDDILPEVDDGDEDDEDDE